MAKAVGIDIGSHACKVAVVDGGPKGAKLLRFAEAEYETGDQVLLTPAIVSAALRKALAEAKAPKNAASVALPAEQCVLREISVPFTQDDQIKKVAKFEFEPHLHSASIDDVVIDYLRTGPSRGGTRLLVFAAAKSMLTARLEQLRTCGVDPLHLDVDVAALFNVARQSGALDEHPNCLLIDIGARTTKAVTVHDGAIKVARSIRLGSQSALQRLEGSFDGDREAAERALAEAGQPGALAAAPAGTPTTLDIVNSVKEVEAEVARAGQDEFLSRVLRETQRTMPAVADEHRITRVFLTGRGALHARARERIASHFGCEVVDLPVLAAVEHRLPPSDEDRVAASGAVAVGTALKVLGIDAAQVDLRREEFRFARTFDQVKVALAAGVTLLFFTAFVLWLTLFLELGKAKKEYAALRAEYQTQLTETFQNYREGVPNPRPEPRVDDPERYFQRTNAYMLEIRKHLKEQLGLATEVPPVRSGLETWLAVMNSLESVRKQVKYLAVKEETYDQDRGTVKVVVGDLTDADLVANALKKHDEIFANVQTGDSKRTKEGRYEFEYRLELREKRADELAAGTTTKAAPAAGEVRTAQEEPR